jgi:stage II sporulation protein P
MNRNTDQYNKRRRLFHHIYKKSGLYLLCVLILFVFIGMLTSVSPAYRFSSHAITEWTSEIDSSTFLYLMGMENRAFRQAYPSDKELPKLSSAIFHLTTSIRPNDPRSLLGNELPGFSAFDTKIIVAGEGTDYTTLPVESAPPPKDIVSEDDDSPDSDQQTGKGDKRDKADKDNRDKQDKASTGDRDVVFIYNTHNTESFLPNSGSDYDAKINITKVSDRLASDLEAEGIGTRVAHEDMQTYEASRCVVKEAFANNKEIQYLFDIHRDSLPRDKTTKKIDGKAYAKVIFVVGAENAEFEKNLALATEMHELIEKKYPGLSRGVITKKGPGNNGVYNQDLSKNALLIEFGGVDNNFDELFRTADALAGIFSDFYWDAEKVNAKKEE